MRRTGKRLAALLLALVMLASLFPASAFAVETGQDAPSETTDPSTQVEVTKIPSEPADPAVTEQPGVPARPEAVENAEDTGEPGEAAALAEGASTDEAKTTLNALTFLVGGGGELKIILGGNFTAEDASRSVRSLYETEIEPLRAAKESITRDLALSSGHR